MTPFVAALICAAPPASADNTEHTANIDDIEIPDIAKRGEDVTFPTTVGGMTTIGVLLHPAKLTTLHFHSAIVEVHRPDIPALQYDEFPHHINLRPKLLPEDEPVLATLMVETKSGNLTIVLYPAPAPEVANSTVRIVPQGVLDAWKAGTDAAAELKCGDAQARFETRIAKIQAQHQREMAEQTRLAALEGAVLNDREIPVLDMKTHTPPGVTIHSVRWLGKNEYPWLLIILSVKGGVRFEPARVFINHSSWRSTQTPSFAVYRDRKRQIGPLPAGTKVRLFIDAKNAAHHDDLQVGVVATNETSIILIDQLKSRASAAATYTARLRAQTQKRAAWMSAAVGMGGEHLAGVGFVPAFSARLQYSLYRSIAAEASLTITKSDQDNTRSRTYAGIGGVIQTSGRFAPVFRLGLMSDMVGKASPSWYFGGGAALSITANSRLTLSIVRRSDSADRGVTDALLSFERLWLR